MSIDNLNIADFFPELGNFAHRAIFGGVTRPWDIFGKIHDYILGNFPDGHEENSLPYGIELQKSHDGEGILFCVSPVKLQKDLLCASLKIRIGAGTIIEPTACIKGPSLIGGGCEIRHGAYLRGDVIAGDVCTLGHTTEIKRSILMNHTEAGHFNYIGDCVIGSYVNLGAGTKLANLKFRTPEDKKAVAFPEITFTYEGKRMNTGISKFGAIIGDYCEAGCNSVFSPAVMMGAQCWVYPNITVPSGYYPPKSVIRGGPKR
ncbi:MAG: hypothetical protein IEMM0002_0794 [bacterium]|nr:MAG: hypothetical protein IEMM0002_0794 [bacterium]